MNQLRIVLFLLVCFLSAMSLVAKEPDKKKAPYLEVVDAWSQATIPGIPGAEVHTSYEFIVKWENGKYPEAFFWRGANGWLTCSIARAFRISKRDTRGKVSVVYRTEPITNGDIRKGYYLQLKPVTGGKFAIPKEIPASAQNTIFYKVTDGPWMAAKVTNIVRKKDIIQP